MEITPEVVRELIHYDPDTGIFTWRKRERHHFKTNRSCATWNGRYAGKRAGTVYTEPRHGYQTRRLKLAGEAFLEHRLAWIYMTGEDPPEEIDHRNRDATDNRWSNLRESTHSDNMLNMSKYRSNKSGVPGVFWYQPLEKWLTYCDVNGKRHHLGYFADLDEARDVVLAFRAKHGFDVGHGAEVAHYA